MTEVLTFDNAAAISYERYMVPLIFQPFADEVAARIKSLQPDSVLELAAGTGVVTRAMASALPPETEIVATDLAEGMLELATEKQAGLGLVTWRLADGQDLPFGDESFDAVVCQFGIMFFPDKVEGFAEAYRVLRPGGTMLFSSWAAIEENPTIRLAFDTVIAEMGGEMPNLGEVAFGYFDAAAIRRDMEAAGIVNIGIDSVVGSTEVASARDAALGYVQGGPMTAAIREIGGDVAAITDKVTDAIISMMGDGPFTNPLRALFMSARKS